MHWEKLKHAKGEKLIEKDVVLGYYAFDPCEYFFRAKANSKLGFYDNEDKARKAVENECKRA